MSKNELTRASETSVSESVSNATSMMTQIAEMAKDPSIPAEKMIALGEFQLKLYDRSREEEFNKDLNKAIDEMPTITKDGAILDKSKNVRSRYSSFERMMQVVQPILKLNRLRIRFDVMSEGQLPKVATVLIHDNGLERKSGHMPVPIQKPNNSVTMAQAAAMSVTTGKRHVLKATLSIIEADDDGLGKLYAIVEKEDWQEELVETSRREAMAGTESYTAWFKAQPAMHRGYLVDVGEQAKNKAAAAQADEH